MTTASDPVDWLDVYFEYRLAFVDLPDVRLRIIDDETPRVLFIDATAKTGGETFCVRCPLERGRARDLRYVRWLAQRTRKHWAHAVAHAVPWTAAGS